MSKKSEAPLWVDVKQSQYLLVFILVVHALVILSSLLMSLSVGLKLALLTLPGYSLYFYLQRYQQGFYSFSIRHTEAVSWELIENNQYFNLRILRTTVLTSFIIILQVKIDKKHRSLLICRDAVSAEEYRQLFVALKIMKLE